MPRRRRTGLDGRRFIGEPTAVPLPSTLVPLAAGALALIVARRRR